MRYNGCYYQVIKKPWKKGKQKYEVNKWDKDGVWEGKVSIDEYNRIKNLKKQRQL